MKAINSKAAAVAVGVILGGIVVYMLARKATAAAGEAARAVGTAVNPTNPDNIVNSGVSRVGEALTGQQPGSFSLGSWLFDQFNPPYDPNAKPGDVEPGRRQHVKLEEGTTP